MKEFFIRPILKSKKLKARFKVLSKLYYGKIAASKKRSLQKHSPFGRGFWPLETKTAPKPNQTYTK
jgi:hypothetical protein